MRRTSTCERAKERKRVCVSEREGGGREVERGRERETGRERMREKCGDGRSQEGGGGREGRRDRGVGGWERRERMCV